MDKRRELLEGIPERNDRLWIIKTPEFEAPMCDYNWEITGCDRRLINIAPEIFAYSGNAYYVINNFVPSKGWTAEQVEDRN